MELKDPGLFIIETLAVCALLLYGGVVGEGDVVGWPIIKAGMDWKNAGDIVVCYIVWAGLEY